MEQVHKSLSDPKNFHYGAAHPSFNQVGDRSPLSPPSCYPTSLSSCSPPISLLLLSPHLCPPLLLRTPPLLAAHPLVQPGEPYSCNSCG